MRKHRSLGELISTATFLGCGAFILLHSIELFDLGQRLRAYIGLSAALFCILGGFFLRNPWSPMVQPWSKPWLSMASPW